MPTKASCGLHLFLDTLHDCFTSLFTHLQYVDNIPYFIGIRQRMNPPIQVIHVKDTQSWILVTAVQTDFIQ